MGLEYLSQKQLVTLWSELEQALYGDNKFGGDTAEIYAFTLMRYNPCWEYGKDSDVFKRSEFDRQSEARSALIAVCDWFQDERSAYIEIDGESFNVWKRRPHIFDHRVHVKVAFDRAQEPSLP